MGRACWCLVARVIVKTQVTESRGSGQPLYYCAISDTILNPEKIINDDVIIRFANALATNASLKVLEFDAFYEISRNGWNAVIRTLLDTSSIDSTYNSNHTLQDLRLGFNMGVPNDV